MIINVRHTGIVAHDLERMLDFYRQLGFVDENRAVEEGEFIDQVTGFKDTSLEWVKLKAPDGYLLELLQYHSHPMEKNVSNLNPNQLGCSHMAFTVKDIELACETVINAGGSIVNAAANSPDGKVKVAYCHDPEGVLIELVEVVK